MQLIIVANCTARKTVESDSGLQAGKLSRGSVETLAAEWRRRRNRCGKQVRVSHLYAGRAFSLAREVADSARADLRIVSAGMGLVRQDARVPSYSLTVTSPAADCILDRASRGASFSAAQWWQALRGRRPTGSPFRNLLRRYDSALVVVAVSGPYLEMIADELSGLDSTMLERIRIVGARAPTGLPVSLRPCVMPYDARLNDPRFEPRGTEFDFPARALRHFVRLIQPDRRLEAPKRHARRVRLSLARRQPPRMITRERLDQRTLHTVVERLKRRTSSRLRALRLLRRELGYACEQRRFARAWSRG